MDEDNYVMVFIGKYLLIIEYWFDDFDYMWSELLKQLFCYEMACD